jgi:hypothetical protein
MQHESAGISALASSSQRRPAAQVPPPQDHCSESTEAARIGHPPSPAVRTSCSYARTRSIYEGRRHSDQLTACSTPHAANAPPHSRTSSPAIPIMEGVEFSPGTDLGVNVNDARTSPVTIVSPGLTVDPAGLILLTGIRLARLQPFHLAHLLDKPGNGFQSSGG